MNREANWSVHIVGFCQPRRRTWPDPVEGALVASHPRPSWARKLSAPQISPRPCRVSAQVGLREVASPLQQLFWAWPQDARSSPGSLDRGQWEASCSVAGFLQCPFYYNTKGLFSLKMSPHTVCQSINLSLAIPLPVLFLNLLDKRKSRARARPLAFTSGHVESPTPGGWPCWCICRQLVSACPRGWLRTRTWAGRQCPAGSDPAHPHASVSDTLSAGPSLGPAHPATSVCPWHLVGFAKSAP